MEWLISPEDPRSGSDRKSDPNSRVGSEGTSMAEVKVGFVSRDL